MAFTPKDDSDFVRVEVRVANGLSAARAADVCAVGEDDPPPAVPPLSA